MEEVFYRYVVELIVSAPFVFFSPNWCFLEENAFSYEHDPEFSVKSCSGVDFVYFQRKVDKTSLCSVRIRFFINALCFET